MPGGVRINVLISKKANSKLKHYQKASGIKTKDDAIEAILMNLPSDHS